MTAVQSERPPSPLAPPARNPFGPAFEPQRRHAAAVSKAASAWRGDESRTLTGATAAHAALEKTGGEAVMTASDAPMLAHSLATLGLALRSTDGEGWFAVKKEDAFDWTVEWEALTRLEGVYCWVRASPCCPPRWPLLTSRACVPGVSRGAASGGGAVLAPGGATLSPPPLLPRPPAAPRPAAAAGEGSAVGRGERPATGATARRGARRCASVRHAAALLQVLRQVNWRHQALVARGVEMRQRGVVRVRPYLAPRAALAEPPPR